jgi:hypothetical protein
VGIPKRPVGNESGLCKLRLARHSRVPCVYSAVVSYAIRHIEVLATTKPQTFAGRNPLAEALTVRGQRYTGSSSRRPSNILANDDAIQRLVRREWSVVI